MNNEQKLTAEEILDKHLGHIERPKGHLLACLTGAMEEYAAQEAASTQSAGVSKEEIWEMIYELPVDWVGTGGLGSTPEKDHEDWMKRFETLIASLPSNPKGEVEQKEVCKTCDGYRSINPGLHERPCPDCTKPTNQPSPDQEQPE